MSKFSVGIDIGTYQIKVVVAEETKEKNSLPKIVGAGYAESKGMRHGYIINKTDTIRSIRKAIRQAEKSSQTRIERAYVSIGGIGLSSHVGNGTVMISRADNEITELDLEKASKDANENIPKTFIQNRKIIHSIPIEYKIDGKPILGNDPIGMKGVKLEVKTLFIACLAHHLQELIQTVEASGIEIVDVMAAPLASGLVTLSKTEKIAGGVLANIGSETVSIVVYENDIPISMEVFPIGSNDITNDIALGLKVSLEEAEDIKIKRDKGIVSEEIPKKKLDDIVSARMSDIFELIDSHLKKIGKSGLLPAGIIITGGGSGIINIEDLAKASLKLPSKIAELTYDKEFFNNSTSGGGIKVKDATWAVAYGLCVFGFYAGEEGSVGFGLGKTLFKKTIRSISSFFHKFLP